MARKRSKVTEVRRICNLVPSKNTEQDWKFEDAVRTASLGAVAALPPAVDLRVFLTIVTVPGFHRRNPNPWVFVQSALNFIELYTVTANLYHPIHASQVDQETVWKQLSPVTRQIDPLIPLSGIG